MKNLIMLAVLSIMIISCNREELPDGTKTRLLYHDWHEESERDVILTIDEEHLTYDYSGVKEVYTYVLDNMNINIDLEGGGYLSTEIK